MAVARRAREAQHEAVRVLHHRRHLVRHLAVVLPVVDVAEGEDALGLLHAHQLVRGRDEVHEEIRRQAARVVPEEPPLEEPAEVEVARRRGAEEPLEVDGGRRGVRRDRVVPGARRAVAVDLALDERDLSEPAAPDELGGLLRAAHAHVLAADLHHLAALLGGRDERLALLPRVRHRLLDVDVLAGGQRVLRHLQMPVIGRGDDDGIDVGARRGSRCSRRSRPAPARSAPAPDRGGPCSSRRRRQSARRRCPRRLPSAACRGSRRR